MAKIRTLKVRISPYLCVRATNCLIFMAELLALAGGGTCHCHQPFPRLALGTKSVSQWDLLAQLVPSGGWHQCSLFSLLGNQQNPLSQETLGLVLCLELLQSEMQSLSVLTAAAFHVSWENMQE